MVVLLCQNVLYLLIMSKAFDCGFEFKAFDIVG